MSTAAPLLLHLTPMSLPEANMERAGADVNLLATERVSAIAGCNVLLQPGEASEVIVLLENRSNQTLQLNLQIEGEIPPSWYLIGTEGDELLPGQRMEAVVYFRAPADFFEEQRSLAPHESLTLDWQCRLCAYFTDVETGRQQVEFASLNLYIRPQSLYLDFLPTFYREVDFIGRLLKLFEQAFEPANQAMNVLWAHLDPLTAPAALMPFLAHWVAWDLEPRWSLSRQRHLVRNAVQLYRWRGTKRGLRLYLHLYTNLPLDEELPEADKHISITEVFGAGFVVGGANLGEGSTLGGGRLFHFVVRLRNDTPDHLDPTLIRTIIEQEKPAFCTYDLFIDPAMPQRE